MAYYDKKVRTELLKRLQSIYNVEGSGMSGGARPPKIPKLLMKKKLKLTKEEEKDIIKRLNEIIVNKNCKSGIKLTNIRRDEQGKTVLRTRCGRKRGPVKGKPNNTLKRYNACVRDLRSKHPELSLKEARMIISESSNKDRTDCYAKQTMEESVKKLRGLGVGDYYGSGVGDYYGADLYGRAY